MDSRFDLKNFAERVLLGLYFPNVVAIIKRNSRGFFKKYRWFILFFTVGLLFDAISTTYFMHHQGIQAEFHPMVMVLSVYCGIFWGPMLGAAIKAVACLALAIYFSQYAHYLFLAVTIVYLWAGWYNVWGVHIYTPYFITLFK